MAKIHPRSYLYMLLGAIVLLLLLHLGSYLYVISNDLNSTNVFFEKTNFGKEKNLPAIFSSSLLFVASILLGMISLGKLTTKKNTPFWSLLSLIFLFLGFDELLRIHENINLNVAASGEAGGVFHYSWVIPYGIALILLGFFLFKPLFQLPKRTLHGFIFAGIIFLSGALVIEMFTGWYLVQKGLAEQNTDLIPEVFALYTIEELLEMTGISLFIYYILEFKKEFEVKRKLVARPGFNKI